MKWPSTRKRRRPPSQPWPWIHARGNHKPFPVEPDDRTEYDTIVETCAAPPTPHCRVSRRMREDPTQKFEPRGPIMMPGRMLLGVAQPIQLASAILFLASPASSYMTGHVMPVDGGYLVG